MGAPKQSPIASPGPRVRPGVQAALALIGFTAVVAQIVLMRELMVVFVGNEISLGVTLATWLLWTAIGSGVLGRVAQPPSAAKLLALLLVLEAAAFPASIFLVRASRGLFHPEPGELLGPGAMFLAAFLALSLFCVISGWLFAAGVRLYAHEAQTSAAAATGSMYLLEALGSGVGGIAASIALIRYWNAFQIASLLALLNLLAAGVMLSRRRRAAAITAVVLSAAMFFWLSPRLEHASLARLWRGFDLVISRNSVYGNLVVIRGEGSRSLYENGLNLFNVPDVPAAEEAVHYALLEHPAPRAVLLLGGGANGSAVEILRHPSVERVDYVELDPAIFALAQTYFPQAWAALQGDPRIHTHLGDGRLFLKTTAQKFDVIIVNLPGPQTALLNRFYTREFFREAAARLNPGGLVALQLRSSENYIGPELGAFLACINRTLRDVFPDVAAIPGETVHFFAANAPGMLVRAPQPLIARLQERRLQTSYVSEYYIPFRMMPGRMLGLDLAIAPQPQTPVNRDFAPIAYYFDVALWSGQFNRGYRDALRSAADISFTRLLLGVVLLLFAVAAGVLFAARRNRARAAAGLCVAGMGFTLIALEMLLLLGFQAIYGYVYHQLAIVIAAFMVGLALGSWQALRFGSERHPLRTISLLQLLAAAAPLLLFAIFQGLAGVTSAAGLFAVRHIVFPLLALLSGMMGGYQFPLATRVFVGEHRPSAGTLYALDLLGACVAAVLLSAYFVPVFGLLRTAVFIAAADLPLAAAGFWASRTRAAAA
jgi:spermidine synthase